MRPQHLELSARSCPTTTTTNHQISLNLDPIDFDARVAAWEKNEAREALIMSSANATAPANAAAASPANATATATYPGTSSYHPGDPLLPYPRSLHFSTIEPTAHNYHQRHHGTDQVWPPTPSPHTHRTFFSPISLQSPYSIPRIGTSLDPQYPFLEYFQSAETAYRVRNLDRTLSDL